jgi:hypothetical protein
MIIKISIWINIIYLNIHIMQLLQKFPKSVATKFETI